MSNYKTCSVSNYKTCLLSNYKTSSVSNHKTCSVSNYKNKKWKIEYVFPPPIFPNRPETGETVLKSWLYFTSQGDFPVHHPLCPTRSLHPNLNILFTVFHWNSVCCYPINGKTAEPVVPIFCLATHKTPEPAI